MTKVESAIATASGNTPIFLSEEFLNMYGPISALHRLCEKNVLRYEIITRKSGVCENLK